MIISFSLENWLSFRDPITFSMVASRERQHGERVPRIAKYQTRILPIAAIYGGNASGKTNFFKALSFAKRLIVGGTKLDALIPIEPFLLDPKMRQQPSRFVFELLVNDLVYEYSFALTRRAVLDEKLVLITSASEKTLYHRQLDSITFDKTLEKNQFLQFAFRGTRDNQLFLTNSVLQKVDNFRPVYDWFKNTLVLIAPDSRFESFELFLEEGSHLYSTMNELLPKLDTGISHIGGEEFSFENTPIPESLKLELQEHLKEGMSVRLLSDILNERFIITCKNGDLLAKKLVTYHLNSDGSKSKFDIRQESDGSQRIIDLLPAFLDLTQPVSEKVYVIDEIDRSLHSLLTRRLIETYLASCTSDTRTQLLLTTHDTHLMDQTLLRRDEMWVAEKDISGSSSLISFSEYKEIRYDKDIRKSYLQGRLGGIPNIYLESSFSDHCINDTNERVD